MEFVYSKHGQESLKRRMIEGPTIFNVKKISNNLLKTIKRRHKYKEHGIIYFINKNRLTIYICREIDIDKYLLITAYNI